MHCEGGLQASLWWGGRAARSKGVRFAGQVTVPSGERLARLKPWSAEAPFQARIARSFAWEELDQAVQTYAESKPRGRVIVRGPTAG